MNLAFSTLACPDWSMPQIIEVAARVGYDGIELRFVQGEDSIWKLPAFSGSGLVETKKSLAEHGLKICCVDTSCRFHFPDAGERKRWMVDGERMADLAAELGAPGIRIFGDEIQPGADRASTQRWIADSMRELAQSIRSKGVGVWLESHGDFSTAAQMAAILSDAASDNTGVVWDPANSFALASEQPEEGAALLGKLIRHAHIKDLRRDGNSWRYVSTGSGSFPLQKMIDALVRLQYRGFLSFEWEKKWHPELEDAEVALPHFVKWFRENSTHV